MASQFDGPFDGTLHIIQDTGYGPGYTVGGIDTLKRAVSEGTLRAVMLTKAVKTADTWLVTNRGILELREVLDSLPYAMRHGTISWMMLEGEEEPSTVIIHSGLKTEELRMMTYGRLYTSLRKNQEVDDFLKKCREQSYASTLNNTLKNSQPVMSVILETKGHDDKPTR